MLVSLLGKSYEMSASTMKAKSKHNLRFAVASDGHYGENDTDYEMYFANIVKWLNHEAQNDGLDFIVFNGDIIHDKPEFLQEVKHIFDPLSVPYYPVQGNHDMVSPAYWKQTWGIDVNHSFESKNSAFILMTTSNEQGEYLCADLTWLESELRKFSRHSHVFLFLHISQSDWSRHGTPCPDLMDFIAQSKNITAVFHGHDHHEDDVKYHGNVPFLWCGHFGSSWGQEYKGYRIVEVYNDEIITFMKNPLGNIELPEVSI